MKVSLLQKTAGFVRGEKMLKGGEKVLVACSGGPDSVALLFLLKELSRHLKLRLGVAHLNHQLRPEAKKDAEFVKKLAEILKLRFFYSEADVKAAAKKKKWSLEEAGRYLRYQFFEQVARDERFNKIATGHTADDLAETVLLQILRGSGGPAGIPSVRGKVIRPLLDCSRREVLAYLKKKKLPYRIDLSNKDPKFLRNRVRHQLVPLLERGYNPQVRRGLIRLSEIFAEEKKFLEKEARKVLTKALVKDGETVGLKTAAVKKAHPAVRRETMQLVCSQNLDFSPDFETTERLLRALEKPVKMELARNLYAQSTKTGVLWFYRRREKKEPLQFELPKNGKKKVDGLTVSARKIPRRRIRNLILPNEWEGYFDAERLKPPLVLRPVEACDRFVPLGMKGSKKVGDYFTDRKIPIFQREKALVLTSAGKISWVIGHRISEEFKVRSKTKSVLYLKARPDGR